MPIQDRLTGAQMENVLTLLCHSDEFGKLVYSMVDPLLFEGDYRVIAERACEYWRQHKVAPKVHTADLVADIIEDPSNRKAPTYKRMLVNMLQLLEGINHQYVLRQLKTFTRLQKLKEAIFHAAEQLNKPQETTIDDVEDILMGILNARDFNFEPGSRIYEVDSLIEYLEHTVNEFDTGIEQFDRNGVVPRRGTLFLFIGGKGRGKSWFCIQCGKRALQQRKKVLHVSLENSEEETKLRYLMSLFSAPTLELNDVEVARLTYANRDPREQDKRVIGWRREIIPVEFDFKSSDIRLELDTRLELMGRRTENLIIKRFPNRSLTPNGLRGYLDSLEASENFIPDLLIVDYPKLMRINERREEHSAFGANVEELRAIAVERNIALVCPDQLSRKGYEALQSRSTQIAQSWLEVHTADTVVMHSATDAEMAHGLARLYVEHARGDRDKFSVLITHKYLIGQFVIESAMLSEEYMKELFQSADRAYDEDEQAG